MRIVTRLPRHELAALDRDLARLGRGAGALRLRLGEALDAFAVRGGHHACGFSSLSAYALERCERSGRWAVESRTVARRVAGLPRLRAALSSGEVSWSMAELLARHASIENEAELVARGRRCTVRQMREELKGSAEDDAEAEPQMRTLTVTVATEEAWAFECTRLLIEHLEGGKATTDTVVDAMLAEGEVMLQGMAGAAQRDGRARHEGDAARAAGWLRQLAGFRREAELRCEPRIPRGAMPAPVDVLADPQGSRRAGLDDADARDRNDGEAGAREGHCDPVGLDREIRSLARELTQRELALGGAALRLLQADGWRRLGYASAAQYARERVGISYSALKSHVTLARRALREPAVREAVCAGQIGREAALLVSRVATGKTIDAWLSRACERTIKHLHEDVKAAELISRVTERGDVEPPDDELMTTVAELESAVLSGRVYRERFAAAGEQSQMSAQVGAAGVGKMSAQIGEAGVGQMSAQVGAAGAGQMSARDEDVPPPRRGAGRSTLRLRVSDETYRAFRALEQDYLRRTVSPLGFVGFLCLSVWDSWHAGLDRDVAYRGIYVRDRYRCSSPVCTRGDVTPHHLRFRSHGGDDTEENLTALCVWCHLEGVHGGRIRALPPASYVKWTLGERAVLVVQGRRKREVERAA